MTNNYALIIGVEDYSAYDRSMDLPAGTSTAAGAVNDARALYRQCLSMGFSPERIRVLTSPRISPRELGPEAVESMIGDATHDSIVRGLHELFTHLAHRGPSAGLLTFSGHGLTSHGVVICPSDLTGSMDQIIHVASIRAQAQREGVGGDLTMLLDCCRAQEGVPAEAWIEARAANAAVRLAQDALPERMITACQRGHVAYASKFAGVKMGAFTWAITSAMSQWKTTMERGVARLDVSYGELTKRTEALLSALSFEQVPALSGPPEVELLPFLHPGSKVTPGETTPEPDALRPLKQLDSGQYHMIYLDALGIWKAFANITVANGVETWTVCTDLITGLFSASELKLCKNTTTLSSSSTATETAAAGAVWVQQTNPQYQSGTDYITFAPSSANYTYDRAGSRGSLCMTFQRQALRIGYDFLTVTWYNPTAANVTLEYMTGDVVCNQRIASGRYAGACYVADSTF